MLLDMLETNNASIRQNVKKNSILTSLGLRSLTKTLHSLLSRVRNSAKMKFLNLAKTGVSLVQTMI